MQNNAYKIRTTAEHLQPILACVTRS